MKNFALIASLLLLSSCGYVKRVQNCVGSGTCAISPSSDASPALGKPLEFSVGSTGDVSVGWGDATDDTTSQGDLQYQLVISTTPGEIDTSEKAKVMGNFTDAESFRKARTSQTVQGLEDGKTYYFTVLVRDKDGNVSSYPPKPFTKPDVTAPQTSKPLYASAVTASSVTLKWGDASDNLTLPAALQYKVVTALSPASLSTVGAANALTGAQVKQDWTPNLSSFQVTGLSSSSLYLYSMLVKDEAGNISLHGPLFVQTLDVSAPTPGVASFASITATSLMLNWTMATDDISSQSNLVYKVAYSTDLAVVDTIDKVANAAPANLITDWGGATTSAVTGLTSGTHYYFSILVRDEAGNMAMYGPNETDTLDITPPVVGTGVINFGDVGANFISAKWPAATDNVTPAEKLQYRVVSAPSETSIDSIAKVLAISGSGLIQDWSTQTTRLYLNGLASYTDIAIAVLVRDAAGNMTLYPPKKTKTLDNQAPSAPTVDYEVATTTASLFWFGSVDKETPASDLEYKVITSSDPALIDSLERASLVSGPGIAMDWSKNVTSLRVPSGGAFVLYAVVLVRDPSGNTSTSKVVTIKYPDLVAPVVPGALAISSPQKDNTKLFRVEWAAATDNVSAPSQLSYRFVTASQATMIDTIDKVLALGSVEQANCLAPSIGWRLAFGAPMSVIAAASNTISGCYAAVVVRDLAGNMSLYPPVLAYSAPPPIPPPYYKVALTSRGVTTTSAALSWGVAFTFDGSIPQYRLVKAAASTTIDTIAKVDAMSGANLVFDYTASTTLSNVTGLTSGTAYYFAVVAKDNLGNKVLYTPIKVVPTGAPNGGSAPVTGTFGEGLTIFDRSIQLNWGASTDNVYAAADLEYRVVRGYQPSDISSTASMLNCASPCQIVQDWKKNISSVTVNVPSNSRHYFALVVRNPAGASTNYAVTGVVEVGGFQPTLNSAGRYVLIAKNPGATEQKVFSSLDGAALSQVGANFGTALAVDWDSASLFNDSLGNLWANVATHPCNFPLNWVRTTLLYKFNGTAWAPLGGDINGTTGNCTDPGGTSHSGTFFPVLFENSGLLMVAQKESNAGAWGQAYRYTNVLNPDVASAWSRQITAEQQSTTTGSSITSGNTTFLFADADTTPIARKVTVSGATVTTSDINFGVTLPAYTYTGETNFMSLQRLAIDTTANKLYVAFIDPNNARKASMRVFNIASPAWSYAGSAGFTPGEAENLSTMYANNKIYALFKDHTRGGDATLMSFSGGTWTTEQANLFGTEIINPLMKWNSTTNKVDIYAIKPSDTSKVHKVSQ